MRTRHTEPEELGRAAGVQQRTAEGRSPDGLRRGVGKGSPRNECVAYFRTARDGQRGQPEPAQQQRTGCSAAWPRARPLASLSRGSREATAPSAHLVSGTKTQEQLRLLRGPFLSSNRAAPGPPPSGAQWVLSSVCRTALSEGPAGANPGDGPGSEREPRGRRPRIRARTLGTTQDQSKNPGDSPGSEGEPQRPPRIRGETLGIARIRGGTPGTMAQDHSPNPRDRPTLTCFPDTRLSWTSPTTPCSQGLRVLLS